MKRIVFVLLDLLSIAFLTGGYVLQYFTKRKLGMVRWVVYQNSKYQEMMPVDVLKYVAVVVVSGLVILAAVGFAKKRAYMGKLDAVMQAVMTALALFYLGFTVFVSADTVRSYYLIMPLIGAAVLSQTARNLIAVWMCKNEK